MINMVLFYTLMTVCLLLMVWTKCCLRTRFQLTLIHFQTRFIIAMSLLCHYQWTDDIHRYTVLNVRSFCFFLLLIGVGPSPT